MIKITKDTSVNVGLPKVNGQNWQYCQGSFKLNYLCRFGHLLHSRLGRRTKSCQVS